MPDERTTDVGRRDLVKGALAASAAALAALAPSAGDSASTTRRSSIVADENQRPGHPDWQLSHVRLDKTGGFRSPWIEGYCSRQSVEAGETIQFMVSTTPAARFRIEVFRLGYYGGAGARRMTTLGPFDGGPQPVPDEGPRRLRECRWPAAAELTIASDWPSGVYLGKLAIEPIDDTAGPWQSFVVFIVRDRRPADVLFQCSDNTWQAYNRWPDNFSLYTHPGGAHKPGVSVSFDRPYGRYPQIVDAPQSVGSGEFLLWEYPLCYWLEQHGYDVSYCSNSDVLDSTAVARAKAFLSVGHDEYWDLRQYEALRASIAAGTSLLFFSANTAYMVSPFAPSSDGRPNRIITRTASFGPMSEEETKAYGHMMGPFPSAGPDEGLLIGARTIVPFNGGGDWVCTRPEHWIFAGTGMQAGERIPGLVGWEFHGEPATIPGLEVVGEGTVLSGGKAPGHWTATIYPGPRGNFVFNAATIWWAQGLSSPPGHMLPWSHWVRPLGPDPRVQRITQNLLARAIGD